MDEKKVGWLLLVIAGLLIMAYLMGSNQCAARQCPTYYTPTLTRDGCVCLMKAK